MSVKLFKNLTINFREEEFLRMSSCPYTTSNGSLHSPEPCLLMDQISQIILKRVTQGTFLYNHFKFRPVVPEKIFKELLRKFHLVAMATRVFDEIEFC